MQAHRRHPNLASLPLIGLLLAVTATGASAREDDPRPGESWLQSIKVTELRDHRLTRAVLLATDDFSVTRQHELRIEARGTPGREDREVVVHRYEPECLLLARAAGMTADDFCDRLVLTYAGRDLQLSLHSVDANKRYRFTLVESAAGRWESLRPVDVAAPTLTLQLEVGGGARYAWSLETTRARYAQTGVVSSEDLGSLPIDGLEASLGALTDVLRSFHVDEFAYADLPREHRLHRPSLYGLWAEGPLDSHCTFVFCFGSVGGSGGGNSQGLCNPDSPNYAPQYCPWDLKIATWPVSHRMRIRKLDNGVVEVRYAVKNDGAGIFDSTPFPTSTLMAHISLLRFGGGAPLVAPATVPYGDQCFVEHSVNRNIVVDPFVPFTGLVMQPGDVEFDSATFVCDDSTGRPNGRYHPWAHVDPTDTLDTAGMGGNNVEVNRFDWVKLED